VRNLHEMSANYCESGSESVGFHAELVRRNQI
jgi:hypothetical protein